MYQQACQQLPTASKATRLTLPTRCPAGSTNGFGVGIWSQTSAAPAKCHSALTAVCMKVGLDPEWAYVNFLLLWCLFNSLMTAQSPPPSLSSLSSLMLRRWLASCKAKYLAIHSLWTSLPHQDANSNLNPRMWRGHVLHLSFWVLFWSISVVLTCPLTRICWLPIFWSACFVRTRTTFHSVLVKIWTQRSWERYQDHSHQNSSVNNLVKSCQTFSLQTYGCLILKSWTSAIAHSAWFKSVAYGEERSCSNNGQWALFPNVSKRLWFSTFHKACGETSIPPEVKAHCPCQNEVAFLILLSSSAPLNPKESSAGTFQRGYWIFYWQESTKALVPICTICKSLSLRAHTGSGAVPSYIIPTENNAGKTTTAREAHKSLLISDSFACLEERTNTHSWDEHS